MLPHDHDENSAQNQADAPLSEGGDAASARGVPGAEPPEEQTGALSGKRELSAAGLTSIYETARHSFGRMGLKRTRATLSSINQKDGFDCPSCAWPDPDGKRKLFEFCENGAKAVASEATLKRATPDFFASHSVESMRGQSDFWLEHQGRITDLMLLDSGAHHYRPISWDDAFKLIAEELRALESPNEAVFYTSGRASNEAAFLYGLFARQLGTNNLPDCSNMCHESSGLGLTETIGIGKSTVTFEDFAHADCIFIIGQNPGTCHPRMLTELERAALNGCQIVSVNPLPEPGLLHFKNPQKPLSLLAGTAISSLYLPVRINGDVALLKGIMKVLLDADEQTGGRVFAHDFIQHYTEGFDEFIRDLKAESWERIVESSGIARELIEQAAAIASASERMIVCWAMGLTQHKNAVANVQSIVNFILLRGQIGRRGAGVCPVRGHSNVQGDRTVGIWEKMSDEYMQALGKEFNFVPPKRHGYDSVRAIRAMHSGHVKVFMSLGGNFLSATPDTHFTSEAIQRCRLTINVSTKLNRAHLITGQRSLILPCLGRTERDIQATGEQFVSVEDTTGVVHQSHGVLEPASPQLKSEIAIIAGIAQATLRNASSVDWLGLATDYDRIRNHIEHVVPGFEQYNRRVREPGGFYLPNGPRHGKFPTKSGHAQFTVHAIPEHDFAGGKLMLTTVRSHDQFNTTIYGEDDRYRGIYGGRRVIFLSQGDMDERHLEANQWVDIISHYGNEQRRAERFKVIPYPIARGCAAAYFPEANVLVPVNSVADGSNQPTSKSILITVEPSTFAVGNAALGLA